MRHFRIIEHFRILVFFFLFFFFFLSENGKLLESVDRGVIKVCKDFLAAVWITAIGDRG